MTTYRITNTTSGVVLGDYSAETPSAALDAMAREAGYDNRAEAAAVAPVAVDEISVEELTD